MHIFTHPQVFPAAVEVLGYFPGVPVFFFISGYLITGAWENSRLHGGLKSFVLNRFLRLWPALAACLLVSILLVAMTGYFEIVKITTQEFLYWIVAQLTFAQSYVPSFMRGFETGNLNGSLWTISVEIQFYIMTPVLAIVYSKFRNVFWALLMLMIVLNVLNNLNPRNTYLQAYYHWSSLPWLFMFTMGILFYYRKSWVEYALRLPFARVLAVYLLLTYVSGIFGFGTLKWINPVLYLLLCVLILQTAFKNPGLSKRVLGGNDYSYGLYIYHMPVVNVFMIYGLKGSWTLAAACLAISAAFAVLSWQIIERPALRLKRFSIRSVSRQRR